MIYYSELCNRQRSIEEQIMQMLIGNFELFDQYREVIGDERFFATVHALANDYRWDDDYAEDVDEARERVAQRFGFLFDASLIEDLLCYCYDFLLCDDEAK